MGNSLSVIVLFAFILSACQGGGNPPQAPLPALGVSAVTLVSASPAAGASGVPLNAQVVVFFSEPVDPATVTPATLMLFVGTNQVAGAVSSNGSSATFSPSSLLKSNGGYRATITTGILDLKGQPLAQDITWTFTTADKTNPTVLSVAPRTGETFVAPGVTVDVVFSEPISSPAKWEDVLIVLDPSGGLVPAKVTLLAANHLQLVPDSPLGETTTYTVWLFGSLIQDLSGNPLTGGDIFWNFTTTETVPPTVNSVSPPAGATGVAQNAPVTAFFSEPLSPWTVNSGTFAVSGPAGLVAGTVSYDPATFSATFQSAANLAYQTTYQATLTTGIADPAGNTLAANYTWSFTIAQALLGSATLIETEDLGDAENPQIAADGSGNFLAVWLQSDGTVKNVWANRYVANAGWSTPVQLELEATDAESPRVDANANGNAIAVWAQPKGQAKNIYASRFDPVTGQWSSSATVPADLLEAINGTAAKPVVSIDSNGDALVAWQHKQGSNKANIMANFYDFANSKWVGESLVETDNTGDADNPDAILSSGVAYAIWSQKVTTAGVGDGKISIWSSSVVAAPPSGAPLVWPAPVTVEQNADADAANPVIALDGPGNLVACWQQKVDAINPGNGVGDDFDSIYANTMTAGVWGTPQLLESDDTGNATNPRIAADAAGDIMALWEQKISGSNFSLFSQRYDGALGQWISTPPELLEFDVEGTKDHWLAGGSAGSFRAVWAQKGAAGFFNIYVNQWISPGWGAPTLIEADDTGDAQSPKVIHDGQGSPMTVWSQTTIATGSRKNIFANSLQ